MDQPPESIQDLVAIINPLRDILVIIALILSIVGLTLLIFAASIIAIRYTCYEWVYALVCKKSADGREVSKGVPPTGSQHMGHMKLKKT